MDDPTVNRPVKISASQVPIRTDFGKDEARLKWSNRPSKLSYETDGLHVQPEAKTDWWRGTHYPNYDADNAHVLAAEFEGDFVMTTSATFTLTNRFDQYGLVVRVSKDCWLKTSIEYDPPGPPKLGAVVTNMGFSDWSSQSCPQDISSCDLCVRREGPDLIVESRIPGQTDWEQIRVAHLHQGDKVVQAGIYAAAPTAAGGSGTFRFLSIVPGRLDVPPPEVS